MTRVVHDTCHGPGSRCLLSACPRVCPRHVSTGTVRIVPVRWQAAVVVPVQCSARVTRGVAHVFTVQRLYHPLLALLSSYLAKHLPPCTCVDYSSLSSPVSVPECVDATPSVRRVVVSSSVAAVVADNWERGRGHVYSEADWAQVRLSVSSSARVHS